MANSILRINIYRQKAELYMKGPLLVNNREVRNFMSNVKCIPAIEYRAPQN